MDRMLVVVFDNESKAYEGKKIRQPSGRAALVMSRLCRLVEHEGHSAGFPNSAVNCYLA